MAVTQTVDGAGDQLLPGAGFAEDKHGAVTGGNQIHLLQNVAHGITLENDFTETFVVVNLFVQPQVFMLEAVFQRVISS